MSLNQARLPSLREKLEALEEVLTTPSELEEEEEKIKRSKKPAKKK